MKAPPPHDKEMPFTDHLGELRSRLGKVVAAISIAALVCYCWADSLFALLTQPLRAGIARLPVAAEGQAAFKLIGTGPAEAFVVKLKVALVAGLLISAPLIFYQLWCFIAPALYSNERKFAVPFVASSTFFFLTGVTFCFKVVLPFAFEFFLKEYVSIDVNPDLRIGEYLSFTVQILLVFGVVFELPVLSYFLARIGVLDHRWLIKNFRYSVVGVFIVAAVLTPPDVVTQCLLAAPLLVLYALCIAVTYYARKELPTSP